MLVGKGLDLVRRRYEEKHCMCLAMQQVQLVHTEHSYDRQWAQLWGMSWFLHSIKAAEWTPLGLAHRKPKQANTSNSRPQEADIVYLVKLRKILRIRWMIIIGSAEGHFEAPSSQPSAAPSPFNSPSIFLHVYMSAPSRISNTGVLKGSTIACYSFLCRNSFC